MATVLSEKMHAYEAAKAAGRVPYKVADLGLAEVCHLERHTTGRLGGIVGVHLLAQNSCHFLLSS